MSLIRRLATFVLSASLLTGTAVTLAPSATAAGSATCTVNTPDDNAVVTASGVNFRTGPGTGYSSKGLLYRGDLLRTYCVKATGGHLWYYSKLRARSATGLSAGTNGWIRRDMFRFS